MNRASQYRIMHEFNKKGGLLIVSDIASRYLSLCCETVIHIGVHDLYQYMSHLTHVKGVMHSYIYDTNMTEKQLKTVLKHPVITISKEDYKRISIFFMKQSIKTQMCFILLNQTN